LGKAKMLAFAVGTNVYKNSLVLGEIRIGKERWIGIGSNIIISCASDSKW
jgi:hypothetical protein